MYWWSRRFTFGIGHAFGLGFQFAVDFALGLSLDFAIGVSIEFGFEFAFGISLEFAFGHVVFMTDDLTVVFLTVNTLPAKWEEFHREALLRATDGRPMIVVSKIPMNLGRPRTEYLIQSGTPSGWNVYVQILRAAKLAKTKYIAVAEDDTLYPARHFSDFRPPDDAVAYDMSRWSVFSWSPQPFFSAIRKHGNFTMIGPTALVVRALEERQAKYPNGNAYAGEIGRRVVERHLGLSRNKLVEWYCTEPMVNLCHPQGLSPTYVNTPGLERKPGELKAWDIPVWGKASDIANIYNSGVAEDARLAETP